MKIKKGKLQQIIREELTRALGPEQVNEEVETLNEGFLDEFADAIDDAAQKLKKTPEQVSEWFENWWNTGHLGGQTVSQRRKIPRGLIVNKVAVRRMLHYLQGEPDRAAADLGVIERLEKRLSDEGYNEDIIRALEKRWKNLRWSAKKWEEQKEAERLADLGVEQGEQ